ncbi:DUF6482 family protein [Aestuariibacter halophilus]|uniref:DUF6482 family protein n=1 Tax=Fluctibacter halophilus TaxID=226011 RepID=A0ABS8GB74_9ALTE|nr:DUF6482 family protein [Aestuariibacter halophilus]MCC2617674.1 DUF6482 family protein [Aestuariibacter halophilus]
MNLIIEALEGGNYLASIVDGARQYCIYDQHNQPKCYSSINSIKQDLSLERFEHVYLQHRVTQDEMIGQPQVDNRFSMEIEWH